MSNNKFFQTVKSLFTKKKDQDKEREPEPSVPSREEIAEAPVPEDAPILKVEHLKKYFPIARNFFGKPIRFLRAVDDVSFTVERGTAIGVVGESGCGKTTLGRTILRLYDIDGGTVQFCGEDLTKLKQSAMQKYRTRMQLIFQDPYSSLSPRMTVGAIISEGVRAHKIVPREQVHDYVLEVMRKCGLQPQYYDRYPHEFSGGQRQRICIARALAVKPELVICDEPVSALDVSIQAQIINLLKELQAADSLTYVFISHDLSVVKYITDQVMVMYLGNVMELGATEKIFAEPLHPYTKALFSAVPVPNPDVKMNRIILEGDIPSPANPPKGCKFHTRCSSCMNACRFIQPGYNEVREGHFVACHLYDENILSRSAEIDGEYVVWLQEQIAAAKSYAGKREYLAELERMRPDLYTAWLSAALLKRESVLDHLPGRKKERAHLMEELARMDGEEADRVTAELAARKASKKGSKPPESEDVAEAPAEDEKPDDADKTDDRGE